MSDFVFTTVTMELHTKFEDVYMWLDGVVTTRLVIANLCTSEFVVCFFQQIYLAFLDILHQFDYLYTNMFCTNNIVASNIALNRFVRHSTLYELIAQSLYQHILWHE